MDDVFGETPEQQSAGKADRRRVPAQRLLQQQRDRYQRGTCEGRDYEVGKVQKRFQSHGFAHGLVLLERSMAARASTISGNSCALVNFSIAGPSTLRACA